MYMSALYTCTVDLLSQQHSQQYSNRITTTMQLYTFQSKGFPYVSKDFPFSLSMQPIDRPSVSRHTAYRLSLSLSIQPIQIVTLSLSTQPIIHVCLSAHSIQIVPLSLSTQPILCHTIYMLYYILYYAHLSQHYTIHILYYILYYAHLSQHTAYRSGVPLSFSTQNMGYSLSQH